MPFHIVRNDITKMQVDAIVNAANEGLRRGGGVCGAIFAAAGAAQLQAACDEIGHCDTGSSVATPAFALPARHVIHTVGPVWRGGEHGEEKALRSCYQSALALAWDLGDESVAFPLVSSGTYGYPKGQAIDVALSEIEHFLDQHEMDIFLIVFDASSLRASHGRFGAIAEFVNDQYVERSPYLRREGWEGGYGASAMSTMLDDAPSAPMAASAKPAPAPVPAKKAPRHDMPASPLKRVAASTPLRFLLDKLDASFSTTLLQMIDQRGLKDSEVYKRANMSRQHFSKIRGNPSYQPKKHTVLALAVALQLDVDETRLLLERAGFALTHADKRDIIVEYFIGQGVFDIHEINLALYSFDQPLLG